MDGQCGSQYSRRTGVLIQGGIHQSVAERSLMTIQGHKNIGERRLLDTAAESSGGRTVSDNQFYLSLSEMIY